MIDLPAIVGFDRDDGNARKNENHGVSQSAAVMVFFNHPMLLLEDARHSGQEDARHSGQEWRYHASGSPMRGAGCTLHSRCAKAAR
ncbi:MAG: BrnT family toxin [Burkholderiaceae bacterium]